MKRKFHFVLAVFVWTTLVVAGVGFGAGLATWQLLHEYRDRAEAFNLTKLEEVPQRSEVLDVNGQHYSFLHGENRLVVPLAEVSPRFIDALQAREDTRFWKHHGVDLRGIIRAAVANLKSGGIKEGASTITQQLARNAYHLRGRTMDRKALEAALAQRIERHYSKEKILELYVNRIYFGSGFHGIEAAARGYFGKSASALSLGESALLAGLIRSPGNLSPLRDFSASRTERDAVLERMQEVGLATADEVAAAKVAAIKVAERKPMRVESDYVVDAVNRELQTLLLPETIEYGGLRIFATIDPELQRMAQEAVNRQLEEIESGKDFPHPEKSDAESAGGAEAQKTRYLQAALVAVENRTGAVRAVVGGRDFEDSKYNRALVSRRQIGSTFKPFVYATAFERGVRPSTLIDDSRIDPKEFEHVSKGWSPANSDGKYVGPQRADWGLLKSRNTMTVRLGQQIGLAAVRSVAEKVGIGQTMPPYPVSFLGGFEATVRDLTAAYTVFANNGVYRPPYTIARIEDQEGRVIYEAEKASVQALRSDAAWLTSAILQEVMRSGTAAKSQELGWKRPAGGKTGTTNDFHDAWFVGYTSSLTCGVWIGLDEPQTIMKRGYGSALALPVWVDFMRQVPERNYPSEALRPAVQLVKAEFCAVSGLRATSVCRQQNVVKTEELPVTSIPRTTCTVHPEPPPPVTFAAVATPPPASAQVVYQATPVSTPTPAVPEAANGNVGVQPGQAYLSQTAATAPPAPETGPVARKGPPVTAVDQSLPAEPVASPGANHSVGFVAVSRPQRSETIQPQLVTRSFRRAAPPQAPPLPVAEAPEVVAEPEVDPESRVRPTRQTRRTAERPPQVETMIDVQREGGRVRFREVEVRRAIPVTR